MKLGLYTVVALAASTCACGGTAFSILDAPPATDAGHPIGDDVADAGGDSKASGDAATEGDNSQDAAEGSVMVDAADAGVDTGIDAGDVDANCTPPPAFPCSSTYGPTVVVTPVSQFCVMYDSSQTDALANTPFECATCQTYTCACLMMYVSGITSCNSSAGSNLTVHQ